MAVPVLKKNTLEQQGLIKQRQSSRGGGGHFHEEIELAGLGGQKIKGEKTTYYDEREGK